MTDIGAQLDVPGVQCAPFVVALVDSPNSALRGAKRTSSRCSTPIADSQERMPSDVVRFVDACEALGKALFVTVSNKAEGSRLPPAGG